MKFLSKPTSFPSHVKVGGNASIDSTAHLGIISPRVKGAPGLVIGSDAIIRSGSVIYTASRIGDHFEAGHNIVIREQNRIGHHFSIWNNSTVDYGCSIGNRVKIHCNCYVAQYTTLEDDVFLAPGVIVANDLYPGIKASAKAMRGPHLEKGVQVGTNSTLLPYVRVGRGSLIGAGSVVTRDVPPFSLAYGNPARVRGRVSPAAWTKKVRMIS
jgi:acetyltransferase-like isoleucine patch superfamily enzyme